ncbi:MAG: DUF4249 domain-containing protein [Bacteroidetes bacterium]|nr:DUF4249 domain-containing protein [Bacteroidota bacterium]MBS1739178.1 DUF4249 domain-containing protein [Bacteroidota bacterium]MBS1776376.1 DUF4249 domain-containing protein [Bacteroidota bacterium]
MMKISLFQFLILSALCIIFFSCEKEVNINLQSGASKIVIDGQIEPNGVPFVVITKSIGYFSKVDLSTLENNFVHGAKVTVSDGFSSVTLKEYSLDTGLGGVNKFYLYTVDTSNPTSFNFRGVTERQYKLTVSYDGKVYESVTKIPNVRPIDSMWFRPPSGDPKVKTAMMMFIRFTDPDTPGNYIRYFTRRNQDVFYPGINSVYDDEIVNGQTIDSLYLAAGYNRAKDVNIDSLGIFFRGDTVTLRWCAIDQGVFNFFRTFEYATGTVGNPFASPVNVQTNIKGGALGVWAGYGASYTTAIIPK